MIRILVTAPDGQTGFSGSIELVYGMMATGGAGRPLLRVDMSAAAINDRQREYILAKVPRYYGEGFEQQWGTDKLRFAEGDIEYDFDSDFWVPYDKKVNRIRCVKLWSKMSKADRAMAVIGLAAYFRYLVRTGYRAKKDPENYLKNRMWETDWDNLKE